jgi:hypothetical protein
MPFPLEGLIKSGVKELETMYAGAYDLNIVVTAPLQLAFQLAPPYCVQICITAAPNKRTCRAL